MFQSVILCIYAAVVCRVSALPENFVFALKFVGKIETNTKKILGEDAIGWKHVFCDLSEVIF